MNCLKFRRSIMVEPDIQEAEVLVHAEGCKTCASFFRKQLDFDKNLRNVAMMPVPEQLASRILLHQRTNVNRQVARQRRWYAVAASIVLAVAVIIGVEQQITSVSVEELVIAHINDEPQHLKDQLNVQQPEFDKVLADIGLKVSSSVGRVNYAGGCNIRNKEKGAHLVLQGNKGPVTVLFMPGETVATRTPIQDKRFHGVIFPAQHGSIAVVGEKGELIEAVEQKINMAVGYVS